MSSEDSFELISITEVLDFLRRRSLVVILCGLLGATSGFKASGYIPKKYKSKATVAIDSGYFHHPLVSDIVSEIQDTSEMSTQRLALIRTALTDTFLTEFSNTFISSSSSTSPRPSPVDLESVLKRIEYFPTNPSSFQLSVTLNSPEKALRATENVLTQILSVLRAKREEHLLQSKFALEQEAERLLGTLSLGTSGGEGDNLETQLAGARAKLATLEEHLSASHPDVVSLHKQLERLLNRQQNPSLPQPGENDMSSIFLSTQSRTTKEEIISELLKKISNLNIVLNMERSKGIPSHLDIIEHPRIAVAPFAPNRVQFMLIGAVGGLVVSLSIAVAQELRRRRVLLPHDAARYLALPLISELPAAGSNSPALSSLCQPASPTLSFIFLVMSTYCGG